MFRSSAPFRFYGGCSGISRTVSGFLVAFPTQTTAVFPVDLSIKTLGKVMKNWDVKFQKIPTKFSIKNEILSKM
jgi:hypothetical protein